MSPQDLVLTPRGVRFWGRYLPCSIGKGGIRADKREGDGATPVGIHRIVGMLYRADRIAPPAPWARPIGPGDLWSDDMGDAAYNHLVHAPYGHSHERLRRGDPLYDLVLVTDWNWPEAEPGRGSAIFVHQWRRPGYPTEGCVAFSRPDLHWLARRVRPGTRLIIPPL
ncbi:L,D-transpeptidase family protein [Ruegeria pomeroyi]|uniref:L,D-transpeptidase family protein n=1 Tax=Ruegeria alba TaxID=2916756 RepID=A0ABS9NV03_9RHOB|nr:L,D-transpeptidase family protein [Ruegeria pomeroyi]MCG6558046.1 L,D-transpeptidase family protein [Ruegeria alba]MCE8521717.1 L,D-transpeptidase family protein [Ruegeria pomeroyi]MCE8525370.1 L,D-transpeptidase family protein [Ruegeria pomeroyi]MCE8529402.1 L,D-transpeptidase family protein [Ruegeria pomeroyi]